MIEGSWIRISPVSFGCRSAAQRGAEIWSVITRRAARPTQFRADLCSRCDARQRAWRIADLILLFILGAQIRVRLGGLSLIADLIAWSTIYAADYHHDPAVPAGEVIAGCSSQTSSKAFWIASVYSAALSVVINLASQSPPSRRNSAAAVPFYADKSVLALTAASRRHFGA